MEELKVLVEVQGVDAKVHELEKERQKLPKLVALAGEDLRAAEAGTAQAQAEVDAVNKARRDLDAELQTENEHLRKLKVRSTEIKTNKEYFAHLKEIEDCQKRVAKLEETTLELMEKAEKAEAELAARNENLREEQAKFEEAKTRIEGRFTAGDALLKELAVTRETLIAKLSKPVAEHYQFMLKSFPDSAVVPAVGGSCSGCRMTIPPQLFANVRKGEEILKCSNCRRILYYKEP